MAAAPLTRLCWKSCSPKCGRSKRCHDHRVQTFWQLSSSHHLDLVVASTTPLLEPWHNMLAISWHLTMLQCSLLSIIKLRALTFTLASWGKRPFWKETYSIDFTNLAHDHSAVYNLIPLHETSYRNPPLPERLLETRLQPLCKAHAQAGQFMPRNVDIHNFSKSKRAWTNAREWIRTKWIMINKYK